MSLEWEQLTQMDEFQGYEVQTEGVYKQPTRFGIDPRTIDNLQIDLTKVHGWDIQNHSSAVKWLERFEDEGYTFECLTSQSEDIYAGYLRKYNLEMLFGKVITECTCIATGSDKDEHLKKWEPGHWWIEDKPQNAIAGLEAGHKPILITHPYNKDFEHEGVRRADTWEDIFNIILSVDN